MRMITATYTNTSIRTRMTDPILLLTQWLSPAFPVGAFAYSHGLETAIADGRIADVTALKAWLDDITHHGGLQSDLVLLASAARRPADWDEIDTMARAICPSAERLAETTLQGTAFCETVNAVWDAELPDLCYPVAVGAAAARLQVPAEPAARLYAQAFLSNLVSAAVRLVPLGQTEGQRLLAQMTATLEAPVQTALATPLDDITSAAFASDIASMRHETLSPRIFRT